MLSLTILLADFGLVVLIWLVQLIVYPSFQYIARGSFSCWHGRYTRIVSFVVVPLMVVQVMTHSIGLYREPTWQNGLGIVLVGLVWVATFTLSVPCHHRLGEEGRNQEHIARLIQTNWLRTVTWSFVFLLSLFGYLYTHP